MQASNAPPVTIDWNAASRALIDDNLDVLLQKKHNSRVVEAMRYAVLAPGKRIRPLLTLAVADFLGGRPPGLMQAACAIEMIHAASLILDDLPCMDNDRERRNRPSTHAVFGEDCAILAAVSLLMQSHCMLASDQDLDAEVRLQLIRMFCDTVGSEGLSLGQYIDLASKTAAPTSMAISDVHHLKTGVLFLAAARAACLICGAQQEQERKILAFTTHVGLAFQLKDDLADLGEPGPNLAANIGVQGAERKCVAHLRAARAAIDDEQNAEVLLGLVATVFNRH